MSEHNRETAVSSLGEGSDRLFYRGHAVEDLAEFASFEEVAHLLLHGRLPDEVSLLAFRSRLASQRALPASLRDLLERLPEDPGPFGVMDALRTGVSFLGSLEPERDPADLASAAERLIARLPGMMVYRHRFQTEGRRIDTEVDDASIAGQILTMLKDEPPSDAHRSCLDASLTLYADLALNASTFACRICASTRADFASCVTAAIATLRGPWHGGASVAVSALLDRSRSEEEASRNVQEMLGRKERVPGFGHALYQADPRSPILKRWARRLAEEAGTLEPFRIAETVEEVVKSQKGIAPNVDFYTAVCYRRMGVPLALFTPLFACARVAGWAAHVAEQRGSNAIIHPRADDVGPAPRPFIPISERAPTA
ncbi:MAG: citrate/2-methylcitrate synthase [Isosphaeraceae bacterium]